MKLNTERPVFTYENLELKSSFTPNGPRKLNGPNHNQVIIKASRERYDKTEKD